MFVACPKLSALKRSNASDPAERLTGRTFAVSSRKTCSINASLKHLRTHSWINLVAIKRFNRLTRDVIRNTVYAKSFVSSVGYPILHFATVCVPLGLRSTGA
jgi:hypothetical protein